MAKGVLGGLEPDPDKGRPHRHTRAKIQLLILDARHDPVTLTRVIDKVAETYPGAVLDAVLEAIGDQE